MPPCAGKAIDRGTKVRMYFGNKVFGDDLAAAYVELKEDR